MRGESHERRESHKRHDWRWSVQRRAVCRGDAPVLTQRDKKIEKPPFWCAGVFRVWAWRWIDQALRAQRKPRLPVELSGVFALRAATR